jgi:hypothetical protein
MILVAQLESGKVEKWKSGQVSLEVKSTFGSEKSDSGKQRYP